MIVEPPQELHLSGQDEGKARAGSPSASLSIVKQEPHFHAAGPVRDDIIKHKNGAKRQCVKPEALESGALGVMEFEEGTEGGDDDTTSAPEADMSKDVADKGAGGVKYGGSVGEQGQQRRPALQLTAATVVQPPASEPHSTAIPIDVASAPAILTIEGATNKSGGSVVMGITTTAAGAPAAGVAQANLQRAGTQAALAAPLALVLEAAVTGAGTANAPTTAAGAIPSSASRAAGRGRLHGRGRQAEAEGAGPAAQPPPQGEVGSNGRRSVAKAAKGRRAADKLTTEELKARVENTTAAANKMAKGATKAREACRASSGHVAPAAALTRGQDALLTKAFDVFIAAELRAAAKVKRCRQPQHQSGPLEVEAAGRALGGAAAASPAATQQQPQQQPQQVTGEAAAAPASTLAQLAAQAFAAAQQAMTFPLPPAVLQQTAAAAALQGRLLLEQGAGAAGGFMQVQQQQGLAAQGFSSPSGEHQVMGASNISVAADHQWQAQQQAVPQTQAMALQAMWTQQAQQQAIQQPQATPQAQTIMQPGPFSAPTSANPMGAGVTGAMGYVGAAVPHEHQHPPIPPQQLQQHPADISRAAAAWGSWPGPQSMPGPASYPFVSGPVNGAASSGMQPQHPHHQMQAMWTQQAQQAIQQPQATPQAQTIMQPGPFPEPAGANPPMGAGVTGAMGYVGAAVPHEHQHPPIPPQQLQQHPADISRAAAAWGSWPGSQPMPGPASYPSLSGPVNGAASSGMQPQHPHHQHMQAVHPVELPQQQQPAPFQSYGVDAWAAAATGTALLSVAAPPAWQPSVPLSIAAGNAAAADLIEDIGSVSAAMEMMHPWQRSSDGSAYGGTSGSAAAAGAGPAVGSTGLSGASGNCNVSQPTAPPPSPPLPSFCSDLDLSDELLLSDSLLMIGSDEGSPLLLPPSQQEVQHLPSLALPAGPFAQGVPASHQQDDDTADYLA
ncbi:hypothetical protein HXX76_015337 [Chlamydomonas incerta]|uniref:Uncharacterized protein n=1 Tax=Chlamydomonas incerta TaxID=51695 RepID=A0A835SEV4_CHLIN|nr:hypothetical protein HXX76_015337 [Chlamydomonas incerta]|eukprot:KAG2423467.1 hypothetical protein HXX76_015337 [Chlamydomonas incerta]